MKQIFEKHLLKQRVNAVISSEKNILLFGEGGTGKSTIISIVNDLLLQKGVQGEKTLPFFVDMKLLDSADEKPIRNFIFKTYCGNECSVDDKERLDNFLWGKIFSEYTILLIIDGFNEGSSRTKTSVIVEIEKLIKANPKIKVVVSSRIEEVDFKACGFDSVEVPPLSDETIMSLVGNVSNGLKEILKIPFFLSKFIDIYGDKDSFVFKDSSPKKATILRNYCEKLCQGENFIEEKKKSFLLDFWLPKIAYEMAKKDAFSLESSVVKELTKIEYFTSYEEDLEELYEVDLEELFKPRSKPLNICRKDFALIRKDKEQSKVSFSHHYWRDFFASKHILNLLKLDKVDELESIPNDKQILRFVGELFENDSGCECDFENKGDSNSPSSPIETFLRNHNLESKKPLKAKATAKLIEIMKVSRNGKIVGDYSNLDLTETSFFNCKIDFSLFDNTIISAKTFSSDGHNGRIHFASFSRNAEFFISIDETKKAIVWNLKKRKKYNFYIQDVVIDEIMSKENNSEIRLLKTIFINIDSVSLVNETDFAISFNCIGCQIEESLILSCKENDIEYSFSVVEEIPRKDICRQLKIIHNSYWDNFLDFAVEIKDKTVDFYRYGKHLKTVDRKNFTTAWSVVLGENDSISFISRRNIFLFYKDSEGNVLCDDLLNNDVLHSCAVSNNTLFAYSNNDLYLIDLEKNQIKRSCDFFEDLDTVEIIDHFFITRSGCDEFYPIQLFDLQAVLNNEIQTEPISVLTMYFLFVQNIRFEKTFDLFSFSVGGCYFIWNYNNKTVAKFKGKENCTIELFAYYREKKSNTSYYGYYSNLMKINDKYCLLGYNSNKVFLLSLDGGCFRGLDSFYFGEDDVVGSINIQCEFTLEHPCVNVTFDSSLNKLYFSEFVDIVNEIHIYSVCFGEKEKTLVKIIKLDMAEIAIVNGILSNTKNYKTEFDLTNMNLKFLKTEKNICDNFEGYVLNGSVINCDFTKANVIGSQSQKADLFKTLHINGAIVPEEFKPDFEEEDNRAKQLLEKLNN